MYKLGIYKSLHNASSEEVNGPIAKLRFEFPQVLSEGIGAIEDMKGQLRVRPNIIPRYMRSRTVPYALRTKLQKELDKLTQKVKRQNLSFDLR